LRGIHFHDIVEHANEIDNANWYKEKIVLCFQNQFLKK
jgi:hypothetical protein